MKSSTIYQSFFITIILLSLNVNGHAQQNDCISDRYQKRVFNNIQVTQNVTFGSAQNVLLFNQSLEMDIYEPDPNEEYLTKRPLVVMFFGGGYLLGSKNDADMEAWCDSLAHRGYVCASVEYRLDNAPNFAILNQGVRAAYRAIQDGNAAIRYLLEDPSNMGLNIDPDYIYTGGESAGAITAINLAYLEEAERPTVTYNYNIFNPDLGCISCSGNNYNQPFSIRGIIDLWGAVLDVNHIDASENVPMVIIHGDQDLIVPYTSGYPFNIPIFPAMFGAVPMDARLTSLGISHEFYPYPGEGHVVYGVSSGIITFPNQYWNPIFTQGHEFLYNQTMAFDSPIPTGLDLLCNGDIATYQFPPNAASNFCWDIQNGTVLSSTSNSVTVQWNNLPGTVTLTEENCIDVSGIPKTLQVNTTPSSYSIANGNMLTGTQYPTVDYETDGIIESNQIIQLDPTNPTALNVDYDSRTLIELKIGFEVVLGPEFHAFIDGCGNQ